MYKINPYNSDPAVLDILLKYRHKKTIQQNEPFNNDLTKFLKLKEVSTGIVLKILDDVLSIRDEKKVGLTCAILNRWFLYKCRDKDLYVIHRPSKKKDILYQIILGKSSESGVFELKLKGKDINVYKKRVDGQNILSVNCISNYETAVFLNEDKEEYTITRTDYDSEQEYLDALLEKGFVTEEEIEIYYYTDPCIEDYVRKNTPRIEFL